MKISGTRGISGILVIITLSLNPLISFAQSRNIDSLFDKFAEYYTTGNLPNAERMLNRILNSDHLIEEPQLIAVYNNLGVVNQMLGKYEQALDFYTKAELLGYDKNEYIKDLAAIYSNKGNIFNIKKSFDQAVGYFEKSIRVYSSLDLSDRDILLSLSSAYLNIGITVLAGKNYTKALAYLNKSLDIKEKYKLPGTELVYLNIAKAYSGWGYHDKAEEYFKKSIERFIRLYNENHYRLAEVYFDYGIFLNSEKRYKEELTAHKKALSICRENYGNKHPLVALAYKHLGDHYCKRGDYKTALDHYQQSLISVVSDFDDPDIFSNPDIDSVLFDIRLLDNLKSKAGALEMLAGENADRDSRVAILNKSLETTDLAIALIGRIRNNYLTEESRIYLSENEKETYLSAINTAGTIYSLTGDQRIIDKMYNIAVNAKAALLRNEITENEFYFSSGIPDYVLKQRNNTASDIAAFNKMIRDESVKPDPDSNKISLWKDELFELNRSMEKITSGINKAYPAYRQLLLKTEPAGPEAIRKRLHKDETILDYIFSNEYKNGKRDLYIFAITRDDIKFINLKTDTVFMTHARILNNYSRNNQRVNFNDETEALHYMYKLLIEPAEKYIRGKRLIIIPDVETGWLSFDAFLTEKPDQGRQDYSGLNYLINRYIISYSFSGTMLTHSGKRIRNCKNVYAFYPLYNDLSVIPGNNDRLPGAEREIEMILKFFRGLKFTGNEATETNFLKVINKPAIFHLAMHSISDSLNSRYSYLLFDRYADSVSDGKLYNYEISTLKTKSPLVVLSSCNSGTGTLYKGEGLMSLARGFTLAGASSVIKTAWEVNDKTSAEIMSGFYYYLSRGNHKDEALRLSRLDYLRETPPAFAGPYFWAPYELIGDNSPVVPALKAYSPAVISGLIIITAAIILYLKRRRIFSERSL